MVETWHTNCSKGKLKSEREGHNKGKIDQGLNIGKLDWGFITRKINWDIGSNPVIRGLSESNSGGSVEVLV